MNFATQRADPEDYLPRQTATAATPTAASAVDLQTKVAALVQFLLARGFAFEPWQVATYITAVRTKPFVILAGISGTGKTKLPRLVAEATDSVFARTPVKPDWTDSSEVVGFANLENHFVPGTFIRAVRDAAANLEHQHFFLFDEMNLARVEHYLAEALSEFEERTRTSGGALTSSPLAPHAPTDANGDKWSDVRLSGNLAIIGSVNMDEAGHEFSRRVLDRAFTIEFSDVDLEQLPTASTTLPSPTPWSIDDWRQSFLSLAEVADQADQAIADSITVLKSVNEALARIQLQVGYRVRDEIALFCLNARDCLDSFVRSNGEPVDPLDLALLMKVLPRVQGGNQSVYRVLTELQVLAQGTQGGNSFPLFEERVEMMLERFDEEGFTSFWR